MYIFLIKEKAISIILNSLYFLFIFINYLSLLIYIILPSLLN